MMLLRGVVRRMTPFLALQIIVLIPLPALALDGVTTNTAVNGKIVYAGYLQDTDGCCPSIHIMNPDGSGRTALAPDGADPAWAPGGDMIAYTDLYEGTCCPAPSDPTIFLMDATGAQKTALVAGRSPEWTPDGKSIRFMRFGETSNSLWSISIGGSNLEKLAEFEGHDPAWSENGLEVAFVANAGRGDEASDIFVLNLDSGVVRNLTQDPGRDQDPSWAPDGTHIVFSKAPPDDSNSADIFTLDTTTLETRRITSAPGNDVEPSWSANGTSIVYSSAAPQPGTYVVSAVGGTPSQISGTGTLNLGMAAYGFDFDWQACQASTTACPGGTLRTPTVIEVEVNKRRRKIDVAILLLPTLTGEKVSVTLLAEHHPGHFVEQSTKSGRLSADAFHASFARPSGGRCRVVARFAGSPTSTPAESTRTFRC